METAKLKKYMKVICIICMVVYAIFTVVGILIATKVIPPEAYVEALNLQELFNGPDTSLYATISGVVIAVSYGIYFLFTIALLRGVKNPSKMMLGIVLYAIITLATGANFVMTLTQGGEVGMALSKFCVNIFMLGAAIQIRNAEK